MLVPMRVISVAAGILQFLSVLNEGDASIVRVVKLGMSTSNSPSVIFVLRIVKVFRLG